MSPVRMDPAPMVMLRDTIIRMSMHHRRSHRSALNGEQQQNGDCLPGHHVDIVGEDRNGVKGFRWAAFVPASTARPTKGKAPVFVEVVVSSASAVVLANELDSDRQAHVFWLTPWPWGLRGIRTCTCTEPSTRAACRASRSARAVDRPASCACTRRTDRCQASGSSGSATASRRRGSANRTGRCS